jgi:ribosomal 30S subunit maturation factor RimM
VLIPLVDDLLQKVDKKNKKLHISIPDGLLDL